MWYGAALAEVLRYAERREEPPAEWLRAAKRRSREAAAHLGSDPVDILRYWADKDLAADVLNVYDGVLLVER